MNRAGHSILVHHPGSNHLAYHLVASLISGGWATRFEAGYFYNPAGRLARVAAGLPGPLGARATRELRRRSHPGIDPARVRLRPATEMVYVAAARFGLSPARLARIIAWRNGRFDAAVARVVRRERPDVVIGHDGSALLAQRAARTTGALGVLNQVVGHVDAAMELFAEERRLSPEFAESEPELPPAFVERQRREILEAERVLVPSDYVRDTLVARGADPARLAILPYGVDVERFSPAPRPPRAGLRLLFVGHIGQRKGLRYLLDAMGMLGPDVSLTLVGRIVCDPAALAPWRDRFTHVPHVPYHEVHTLFQDADVFVYPSLHEGSAFATYEALASGLPVVTTLNAGSVARDGQEGFIVPIRDAGAIAAAVEKLRDAALRARMSAAARARAEQFTWMHYADRLNGMIEQWLASR